MDAGRDAARFDGRTSQGRIADERCGSGRGQFRHVGERTQNKDEGRARRRTQRIADKLPYDRRTQKIGAVGYGQHAAAGRRGAAAGSRIRRMQVSVFMLYY